MNILGFFSYKDGSFTKTFGIEHICFIIIATISIVVLLLLLRKTNHKKITTLLRVLSIYVPIREVIKIVWESYYDISLYGQFNWAGLLPLYACSMFMFVLPFAAWSKNEKVKSSAIAFLATVSIPFGLTNFFIPPIFNSYSFFTYPVFISLGYHYMMVFIGLLLWVTKYYVPKKSDVILGYLPIIIFSIPVIIINYILLDKGYYPDYMLLLWGNGAPLLPKLSNFLAGKNLHFLFTIIMLILYFMLNGLIVYSSLGIKKLIFNIKNKRQNNMD